MPITLADLQEGLRRSRRHFLKHLAHLRDDQWDFKPFPHCKSIRETLQHLIIDDRAALDSIRTCKEPVYETQPYEIHDIDELYRLLAESHGNLLAELGQRFGNAPLDSEICVWGHVEKAAVGIPYFSSEDYYHAGQVAFLRMASDPEWDYYFSIYGDEPGS